MQLSNDYVLIAQAVSTDSNDNMTSIFKMIDSMSFGAKHSDFVKAFNIEPGEKPVAMPNAYVIATSWSLPEKTEKDLNFQVKATIRDPKGEELNSITQDAVLPKGSDKLRFNFNAQGFPVKDSGRYLFFLEAVVAGKVIASGKCSVNVELAIQED